MKVAATEALQFLLDHINETDYKKCLHEFEHIHNEAMKEINQICPEISKAENRLRAEEIKIFREKIVSERKKDNDDNVYSFFSYAVQYLARRFGYVYRFRFLTVAKYVGTEK